MQPTLAGKHRGYHAQQVALRNCGVLRRLNQQKGLFNQGKLGLNKKGSPKPQENWWFSQHKWNMSNDLMGFITKLLFFK